MEKVFVCDNSNESERWKSITCASEIRTTFFPTTSQIRETFSVAAMCFWLLSCVKTLRKFLAKLCLCLLDFENYFL